MTDFNEVGTGFLPGYLGLDLHTVERGRVLGRLAIKEHHLAPNGFLHAAAVVALADTACGYGCRTSLPDGATGFTTVELKANFVGTARPGTVISTAARLVHGGRSTQLWDAVVTEHTTGKTIAVFRCTQLMLYPRD